MLMYAVAVLLAYLGVVASRDTMRPMPTITNSLVNLGKMEISFYFNGREPSHQSDHSKRPAPIMLQKPEIVPDEPCPCSTLRNVKDTFLSNPGGLLNKILMNNDLFSSHKDPLTSTLCCESHEHTQEGTVFFEFPVNPKSMKPFGSRANSLSMPNNAAPIPNSGGMPMMPFLFDTIIPNKSMLPPLKTKSIEIFLFPKKKDTNVLGLQKIAPKKKDLSFKDNIQIVGDKEFKHNISMKKPATTPPTVKKDLNLQEKNEKLKEKKQQEEKNEREDKKEKGEIEKEENIVDQMMIIEPAGKPNAV